MGARRIGSGLTVRMRPEGTLRLAGGMCLGHTYRIRRLPPELTSAIGRMPPEYGGNGPYARIRMGFCPLLLSRIIFVPGLYSGRWDSQFEAPSTTIDS